MFIEIYDVSRYMCNILLSIFIYFGNDSLIYCNNFMLYHCILKKCWMLVSFQTNEPIFPTFILVQARCQSLGIISSWNTARTFQTTASKHHLSNCGSTLHRDGCIYMKESSGMEEFCFMPSSRYTAECEDKGEIAVEMPGEGEGVLEGVLEGDLEGVCTAVEAIFQGCWGLEMSEITQNSVFKF